MDITAAQQRSLEIASFIDIHGWKAADIAPFAADFSPRRYARLRKSTGETAILMDADANQKTPLFIELSAILRAAGLKAPQIYASIPEKGLVLLEDFGTRNIGACIDSGEPSRPYFLRACETLSILHKNFSCASVAQLSLPVYSSEFFVQQAELFLDHYFPFIKGRAATQNEYDDFRAAWLAALSPVDALPQSLLLRDFMPDNLMDLSDGGLGVLDFQDAGIGPVVYDIASLCEEVRRDGGFALLPDMLAHYKNLNNIPESDTSLNHAAMVLSAQRHTRILGILAKLATQDGRKDKLSYKPRIQKHLHKLYALSALSPVQVFMKEQGFLD